MSAEVIAEVGVNHNQNLGTALALVQAAKDAGATAVKFQASTVDEEVSRRLAPDHAAMLDTVVPTRTFLEHCARQCQEEGIEFLCTPAGLTSLEWVLALGVKRIKISSDNMMNYPLIRAALETGLPLIVSTGMAEWHEVEELVAGLWFEGARDLTVLQCTTAYPAPTTSLNLRVIQAYRERLNQREPAPPPDRIKIGWSDHSESMWLPAVAVALGAEMIEKHITLDRDAQGPDHRASLEPRQFSQMVANIREAEAALGSPIKRHQDAEADNRRHYGRSIVAETAIRAGEVFTRRNIAVKRPGGGISGQMYYGMLNKRAKRDFAEGEQIE